jgi:magnesium transporter
VSKRSHHARLRKARRARTTGQAPGSLLINPESPPPALKVFAYRPDHWVEEAVTDLDRVTALAREYRVLWLNVDGLGDAQVLSQIADRFHLHPLAMEDVVNLHQRAKVEEYAHQQFIVTHMVTQTGDQFETEQLGMFLGEGFVITFQEQPGGDCLDPVRDRIRKGQPALRGAGADFLAYSLLDAITDHYFPLLERYGERMEDVEDRILVRATRKEVSDLHSLKRELLGLRRLVWPLRDVFHTLARENLAQISSETRIYLRDCYDHTVRIIDLIETHREVGSDLMDLYLSSVSFRLNEVMKVLTVISALFIPLTFVCSIYGMNFDTKVSEWNMPELEWKYGYLGFWAVIISMTVGQLFFFWKRGWLSRDDAAPPELGAPRPTD